VSSAAAYAGALRAIVERDARTFVSYRTRLVTQLAGLMLTIAIFHYVSRLVDLGAGATKDEYFAFVVVGILIMNVLQSTVATPFQLRQELIAGTFERILVSPFGAIAGAFSMMVFPALLAAFVSVVALALAALIFGLPIEWQTAPLAIPVLALASLPFAAIGSFFLAAVILVKQSFGVSWVMAAISLTGGVYFPIALLPAWAEWLSSVQPFTPTVELLRHLLTGTEMTGSPLDALLRLLVFVAVLTPLGVLAVRAAIRRARARGTILEY
jgi:ABC-type multidrug transport system permease subunit